MKDKSTSSICAANIYNYLKDVKKKKLAFHAVRKDLEKFISSNLNFADDTSVEKILGNFGWNSLLERFTSDEVDLEGLRIALSKKSMKLDSRAQQEGNSGAQISAKSYVPEMLLSHLSSVLRKEKAVLAADSFSFPGVCLLCDISGFTRLSGEYCNLGKNGIDELQKATNGYMGRLVETIYSYGGDIVKFAGDAIICVFLGKRVKEQIMSDRERDKAAAQDKERETERETERELMSARKAQSMALKDLQSDKTASEKDSETREPQETERETQRETERNASPSLARAASEENEIHTNKDLGGASADHSAHRHHPLYDVCVSAMLCAMDLREISTDLLTVHVAISCGEMCFGVLGGVQDKWESLISGECLVQLSQCLDDAPSRNVAVTRQVAEIVGESILSRFSAESMPSTNYLLHTKAEGLEHLHEEDEIPQLTALCASSAELQEQVEKFVPLPVLVGLRGGELNLLAEIREVTTMFLKFDSYDPETHRKLTALQSPFYAAQSLLVEHGAFIRQFLVDDKGCVLIACWGVPTASYLDNALRALRSAVLIRSALLSQGMAVSIGVTTGNVYCGNVGSPLRREYAAIGDVVNLAARLMGKAKHGVLLDDATYKRLDFSVARMCEARPPLTVKGKPFPIVAHAFVGETAPALAASGADEFDIRPMCKAALGKILEELVEEQEMPKTDEPFAVSLRHANGANASSSSASLPLKVVLLEGRVGSGKGAAAKWFAAAARDREYKVVSVAADAKDASLEYRVLSKLLREFLGDVADKPHELRMVVTHLLRTIYANDRAAIERVAVPAVRVAFGIHLHSGNNAVTPSANAASARFASPYTGGGAGGVVVGGGGNASSNASVSTAHHKVPPWMVTETIRDVFSFLLREQPTVVIVENVQFCDESSLKGLLVVQEIKCRAVMMVTMLAATDFAEYHAKRGQGGQSGAGNAASLFSANSSARTERGGESGVAAVEWLDTYRHIVLQSPRTTHLPLGDFNVSEIDAMVRGALGVQDVPLALAEYVQQISGGSVFWINAIIEFMRSTSPAEFMHMTKEQTFARSGHYVADNNNSGNSGVTSGINSGVTSSTQSGSRHKSGGEAAPSNSGAAAVVVVTPKQRGPLFASFSLNNAAQPTDPLALGSLLKREQQRLSSSAPRSLSPPLEDATESGTTSAVLSGYSTDLHRARLDQFIVVRFERLPRDFQKILKAASVIGFEFSRYVLYGILSNALKANMYAALKALVKERWVCRPGGGEADYMFNHPLIYDILYDLTPSSDRTALHGTIAEYYESLNADDPKFFGEMSRHFAYCNAAKAFEYAVKKADYCIEEEGDLELACLVLNESLKFVDCAVDARVVRAVLDKARDLFVEMDDSAAAEHAVAPPETVSPQHNNNNNRARHAQGKAAARTTTSSSSTMRRRSASRGSLLSRLLSCGLCCYGSMSTMTSSSPGAALIANNAVAPEHSPRLTPSRRSARSARSLRSESRSTRSAPVQYTDKGKGLISRLIHRIDRRVTQLLQGFAEKGREGRVLPWQAMFLESDENDDDEGEEISARSNLSWTYRPHTRFRK